MKRKSLVIILLLMFFSTMVIADTITIAANEYIPIELLEKTAESEGSESIDELKIFHHQLFTNNNSTKSLLNFCETKIILKTMLHGLYRPPNFS